MLVFNDYKNGTSSIQSAQDVLADPAIKLGTLQHSFIVHEFNRTTNPLYKKIGQRVKNKHLTKSNKEGIELVKNSRGKYVYILPSDIADYNAFDENCELSVVGSLFHREYAFAVVKDSRLLTHINQAILTLEQAGKFKELYNKWWHKNRKCNHDQSESSQLTSNGTFGNLLYKQYTLVIALYLFYLVDVILS
jgi:hypothetical protein